jgi:hypothetical protein
MTRTMRLFVLVLCLPLLAFSCVYSKQISVNVPSNVIQPLDQVRASPEEKYKLVLEIFRRWVANYEFYGIDCAEYNHRNNSCPDLCEGFIIYSQYRALLGTGTMYIRVFIYYDQKIGKPIIELVEHGQINQTKKSKQMEKELSDLLSERIGKDAIQVIHP